MKAMLALQQFKKCIILFMIGIGCSFLTYMIYIIDPMTMILKYNLQMAPHSFLFKMWQKPNIDIYLKIYIFNITNPIEFLSGKEKLKLQEIGPYVYQEYMVNDNITFNDNNTMSYIPRRTVVYVPEMSVGDPMEDIVNVPNVPYLGILSALSDAGFIVNYPIVQLANLMNTKPILNISVYDYLWGFEDSLIKLASRMMPNFIDFLKFGLLDRLYDEGENIVTINLQKNADMVEEKGRYLSIDKYNGSPGMAQWGYIETEGNETREENTKCNILQGATEGIVFPSYIDKRAIFRIYRKAFCRPLPIIFRKEIWTDNGLPGYLYTLTDDFASPPDQNPDNECFCHKMKTCLKKGLINLTPCYYNIPSAVSLPHFLDADPSLLENVEGLKPDREKHKSYLVLQQTVGMPILFHSRMQTNLIMNRLRYNSKIAAFSDITIPLFWFDLSITSLSTFLTIILKLELRILPIAQIIFMYLLGIIGVMTLMLSLISIVWILNQPQQQEQEMINDNSDLKVPLYNGHYTSINIVSPLKKIASQSYLTDYYN
ncbi:PREDICTED: scavenger receptor class B member 1-like [Atta colombica]|uniref:scavenger receptor class B member 1-like n=1 Tax=Atta colombica TaxID=520822 RepID=UPI00084C712B|nr:PREDICTED: scavenger receptor class B member 1-like [Atta colombica]XP_018057657.1 PREDICTED: scavenger receptor class B member 1-like [Atta colombica]